jgi:hypothetical protein
MRNFKVSVAGVIAIVGSMLLPGCAPLQQQFPILGLLSSPPRPPSLALRAEGIPALPRYRAVSLCRYNGRMSDGMHTQSDSQTITVRRVRDRLLVTSVIGSEQSTALISQLGQRFDFNAADAAGPRLTPDEFGKVQGESGPGMNNMDLYIPPYISGPAQPGQIVSVLRDGTGTVQAAFVYRGLATFQNREAILLDLVRSSSGADIGRTIGYSIVDRARALPLLFEAAGNPSIRVEQIECRD